MSTTDRMAMRYAVEDSYGLLASGGEALQELLITSESLTTEFSTIESQVVLGDRQIHDLIRVGTLARGDINFELMFGNLDDLLQGALADSWASDVLENASDKISFAFEKDFQDISQFYAFRGCRVGGLSINMTVQQVITGALSVMGRGGVFAGATIGTGGPTAAPTNAPMVTLDNLTIDEAGSPIEVATGFSFQTANELREQRVLGSANLRDINLGLFRVSGTLEAYFEDRSYVDKLVAGTPSDFEIVAQDEDSNAYTFVFPRFEFTGVQGPGNTGRSSDVMLTLEWTAYRDPSTGYTMHVER